jgi:hypothetical protein
VNPNSRAFSFGIRVLLNLNTVHSVCTEFIVFIGTYLDLYIDLLMKIIFYIGLIKVLFKTTINLMLFYDTT